MTREEVIRMAREAGLHSAVLLHLYAGKEAALTDSEHDELRRLERFAALVAAREREACREIAFRMAHSDEDAVDVSQAIRARGEP